MKILATFDGTPFSEETLPILADLAGLPDAEFLLMAVAHVPGVYPQFRGEPRAYTAGYVFGVGATVAAQVTTRYPETKDQAIERARIEFEEYLMRLASRLPEGARVTVEAHVSAHPAQTIVEHAREKQPSMIVMASHSREGLLRVFVGSTTEEVVRAGVAPVLVVHPRHER